MTKIAKSLKREAALMMPVSNLMANLLEVHIVEVLIFVIIRSQTKAIGNLLRTDKSAYYDQHKDSQNNESDGPARFHALFCARAQLDGGKLEAVSILSDFWVAALIFDPVCN